jgi:hypothetical protein
LEIFFSKKVNQIWPSLKPGNRKHGNGKKMVGNRKIKNRAKNPENFGKRKIIKMKMETIEKKKEGN